jgi:hypothetical protein
VEVLFPAERRVELDDAVQVGEIQASCRNVCAEEDGWIAAF